MASGRKPVNDALVDEDVFLLVRPANEHELRVVDIDDLKQLADVAVALLGVVSLEAARAIRRS